MSKQGVVRALKHKQPPEQSQPQTKLETEAASLKKAALPNRKSKKVDIPAETRYWAIGFLVFVAAYLGYLWWQEQNTVDAVGQQTAVYELPTFNDHLIDFHKIREVTMPNIRYQMDEVFNKILSCYPVMSNHSINRNMRGGISSSGVPIEPHSGIYRIIRQEHQTREDIIERIGTFFEAVEMQRYAQRQLALYESVERRSQERVKRGLVPLTEQIDMMAKVVEAQHRATQWDVKLNIARLSLVATCRDDQRKEINQYLIEKLIM